LETTSFTALCESAGRWWTIHVPQVEGLTAQVRSLEQAEVVTRQLISRTLGLPLEAIRVDVVPDAPAPLADALRKRYAARLAAQTADAATRDAVCALVRQGFTFPQVATMLGLSPAEIALYGPEGRPGYGPGSAPGPGPDEASGRGPGLLPAPTAPAAGPLQLTDQ
jgi:hypothetical protein